MCIKAAGVKQCSTQGAQGRCQAQEVHKVPRWGNEKDWGSVKRGERDCRSSDKYEVKPL